MKKIRAWKKIAAIMGVLTLTAGLAGCGGGGSNDNEVNIGVHWKKRSARI